MSVPWQTTTTATTLASIVAEMGASTSGGDAAVVPSLSAVVLAYREEPWLEKCVHALLRSNGVDVDVILVDNGCTDGGVARLAGTPGVVLVSPGRNLGFSGGCNAGAAVASGEYLGLVNGDLVVEPDAIAHLIAVAAAPDVGVAGPSIRLAEDPQKLNSDGNELHFLGFSWCGSFGEPATKRTAQRDVATAMGAAIVLRRALWNELGGFDDRYIAYHDDVELCVRCRQRALRVVNVPQAVAVHRYEFSREPQKMFLSERNRLVFVLTALEARTLLLLAPAFVAVELATLASAVAGGWWRQKLDGWVWLLRNHNWVRRRRRQLQTERTVPDRELASLTATRLRAGNYSLPGFLRPLDAVLAAYWWLVRRLLKGAPRRGRRLPRARTRCT
jgi:GT2 family glycosyltransferase